VNASLLVTLEDGDEPESDAELRDPCEEDGEGGLVVMAQVQGATNNDGAVKSFSPHLDARLTARHVEFDKRRLEDKGAQRPRKDTIDLGLERLVIRDGWGQIEPRLAYFPKC
jgi:hypothetical protein